MRDSDLAASIVDGDARALAEVYDKYADLLWSYSRSLLSDTERAAEVVADTFVIAASKLDVLPAFGRLRAWLYAVARNECQRKLRSAKDGSAAFGAEKLRRAAEVLSTGEQRHLRALLTAAFGGLDDPERDVMQMVWHGLDLAEVAAVLGVARSDAYALFTRARDQLEASVGVLLMGWTGSGGCDAFEDMLYGKDTSLTPDLRTRLSRHIVKCGICTDRYNRQMRPSLMLCLSVGALLSEAADARAAASPAPVGLWEQVYQMTSQNNPESRWHKILGGRRVSFGPDGFPKQAAAVREGLSRAPLKVAAVGAVAIAASATGWATQQHSAGNDAGSASGKPAVTVVAPDASSSATAGAHAGKPSVKAAVHKARHAKKAATPAPSAGTSQVMSSSAATSSSSGSAATSTPATSTSTSSSGSGTTSSGGSGTSSGGSGSSSPAPTTPSSPAPTSTSTTNPVTGVVKGVTGTVTGVTGTVTGIVGGL